MNSLPSSNVKSQRKMTARLVRCWRLAGRYTSDGQIRQLVTSSVNIQMGAKSSSGLTCEKIPHDNGLYNVPERSPQFWMIAGPNGAGKTTLVTAKIKGRIPVINPDEIAERLPLVGGHLDERQAGEIAIRERERLRAERRNFAIETTLSGHSPIRFMTKSKAEGYKITLIFVGIDSAELSQARVADRVAGGGHSVPLDAIIRRYPDTMTKLARAIEIANRSYILDNSEERRRLLIIHEDVATRYVSRTLPEWIKAALPHSVVEADGASFAEQVRLLQGKGWGR